MIPTITSNIVGKMEDVKKYKNPYVNQYVAPYGYHFEFGGQNQGRIMWRKNVDGYTIVKDEED